MKKTPKNNIKLDNGKIINLDKCDPLWLDLYEASDGETMEDGGIYYTEGTVIHPDGKWEHGY